MQQAQKASSHLGKVIRWTLCLIPLTFAGCGGGGDGSNPIYSVGGSVSGLVSGTDVVLQNNGANNTQVSVNASFSFSTGLVTGAAYSVTVLTQPVGAMCTVANPSGAIASSNVSVAVVCTPNKYTIGGSIAGLAAGATLDITDNNGALNFSATTNGAFSFTPALASGSAYSVSIASGGQPAGQNCTVANASGTLSAADVINVGITCVTLSYKVSVNVMGLKNVSGLTLQDNSGDNLVLTTSGANAFATGIANGASYAVTILSQPVGVTCFVTNGSGTISGADVTVMLSCPWESAYFGVTGGQFGYTFYVDQATGGLFGDGVPTVQSQSLGASTSTSMTIDHAGNFIYVGEQDTDPATPLSSIFAYKVDPVTGNLLTISGSPFTIAGTNATVIDAIFDPTSNLLYAYNMYNVNSATGQLTSYLGTPIPTPTIPTVAVESSGSYEYTVSGDSLVASSIDPNTQALAPISGSPFALNLSCPGATITAVDPSQTYLYAACSGTGSGFTGFSIAATTGALTPLTGLPPLDDINGLVIAALN